MEEMDLEHKGFITREEYLKMAGKAMGQKRAEAIFDAIDVNHKGKVRESQMTSSPCTSGSGPNLRLPL